MSCEIKVGLCGILIAVSIVVDQVKGELKCDSGWIEWKSYNVTNPPSTICYKLSDRNEMETWTDAKDICTNYSAFLLFVSSYNEANFVKTKFIDVSYWFGIYTKPNELNPEMSQTEFVENITDKGVFNYAQELTMKSRTAQEKGLDLSYFYVSPPDTWQGDWGCGFRNSSCNPSIAPPGVCQWTTGTKCESEKRRYLCRKNMTTTDPSTTASTTTSTTTKPTSTVTASEIVDVTDLSKTQAQDPNIVTGDVSKTLAPGHTSDVVPTSTTTNRELNGSVHATTNAVIAHQQAGLSEDEKDDSSLIAAVLGVGIVFALVAFIACLLVVVYFRSGRQNPVRVIRTTLRQQPQAAAAETRKKYEVGGGSGWGRRVEEGGRGDSFSRGKHEGRAKERVVEEGEGDWEESEGEAEEGGEESEEGEKESEEGGEESKEGDEREDLGESTLVEESLVDEEVDVEEHDHVQVAEETVAPERLGKGQKMEEAEMTTSEGTIIETTSIDTSGLYTIRTATFSEWF